MPKSIWPKIFEMIAAAAALVVVCSACNSGAQGQIATSAGPVQGPKVTDQLSREGDSVQIQLTVANDSSKPISAVIVTGAQVGEVKAANTFPRPVGDLDPGHSTTFNLLVPTVKPNHSAGLVRIDYTFIGSGGKAAATTYINNEPIP